MMTLLWIVFAKLFRENISSVEIILTFTLDILILFTVMVFLVKMQ